MLFASSKARRTPKERDKRPSGSRQGRLRKQSESKISQNRRSDSNLIIQYNDDCLDPRDQLQRKTHQKKKLQVKKFILEQILQSSGHLVVENVKELTSMKFPDFRKELDQIALEMNFMALHRARNSIQAFVQILKPFPNKEADEDHFQRDPTNISIAKSHRNSGSPKETGPNNWLVHKKTILLWLLGDPISSDSVRRALHKITRKWTYYNKYVFACLQDIPNFVSPKQSSFHQSFNQAYLSGPESPQAQGNFVNRVSQKFWTIEHFLMSAYHLIPLFSVDSKLDILKDILIKILTWLYIENYAFQTMTSLNKNNI